MKKDIIITAILTFCLTTTIFMVATSQSAEYDPWVDLNGDGKIDIFDVVGMTSRYGATGDSTKNVTIARRATKLITLAQGQQVDPATYFTSEVISVDGYSKISVCVTFTEPEFDYWLWTGHTSSSTPFQADVADETTLGKIHCKTYDVMNTYIKIRVRNPGGYFGYLDLDVYLIP